jgi:hypothetical protein
MAIQPFTLIEDRPSADLLAEAQALAERAHTHWAACEISEADDAWETAKNLFLNYYLARDRERSEAHLAMLDAAIADGKAFAEERGLGAVQP